MIGAKTNLFADPDADSCGTGAMYCVTESAKLDSLNRSTILLRCSSGFQITPPDASTGFPLEWQQSVPTRAAA